MTRVPSEQCLLYENSNGSVPKDLLSLCYEMDDLFLNYPTTRKAKRKLDTKEYAKLRKLIERTQKSSLTKLTRIKRFVKLEDHLYLLKSSTKSNPRLYFTNIKEGYMIFLHGTLKKKYSQDPKDTATARSRLEDVCANNRLDRF